jgi:hypothetical protein
MIWEYFTIIFDYVNSLVCPDSPYPTDQPRLDLVTLARLLVFFPAILFLCCFVWLLILIYGCDAFVRVCVSSIWEIAKWFVRCYSLPCRWANWVRRRSFLICRGLPHASVQQHTLWDRWLDGY